MSPTEPLHAVVLAGGKGTRLRPLTDTRPKPLVPFMGAPFATGLLRRLQDAGVGRVTFLVGADPTPFAPLVAIGAELGMEVATSGEERPLDTAGAARRLLASAEDDQPVLMCNGDILTDLDYAALVAAHRAAGAAATLALIRVPDTSAFGVVVRDENGWVERFVEKPAPGTLADDTVNAGTYVLEPGVFDGFPGDGPLSFEREVFPGLLSSGASVLGKASDSAWMDLGTPARYLAGHRLVLEGRCEWPVPVELQPHGDAALVHRDAVVDPDAVVGAGVVVAEGCHVGPRAELTDTVLHARVEVGAGAQIDRTVLAENVVVAPGAVVGPDVVIGDGGRVAA